MKCTIGDKFKAKDNNEYELINKFTYEEKKYYVFNVCGCIMTYDEDEMKRKEIILMPRKYTEWIPMTVQVTDVAYVKVEYRTNRIRTEIKGVGIFKDIKSFSSCNIDIDTYNFDKGLRIALLRWQNIYCNIIRNKVNEVIVYNNIQLRNLTK